MLRFWSTTTLAPGTGLGEGAVDVGRPVGDLPVEQDLPGRRRRRRRGAPPCRRRRRGRRRPWPLTLAPMVYPLLKLADRQSAGATTTLRSRGGSPPACLYQSPAAASRPRRQHPPGPRERQGGRAVRGGRPATPRGRLQSYFQGLGEYKGAGARAGSNCNGWGRWGRGASAVVAGAATVRATQQSRTLRPSAPSRATITV